MGRFTITEYKMDWLNRNEVRNMEGLNREDGLEKFMYPANLNVVGETNKEE